MLSVNKLCIKRPIIFCFYVILGWQLAACGDKSSSDSQTISETLIDDSITSEEFSTAKPWKVTFPYNKDAQAVYVSPAGDDNNPGTMESPFFSVNATLNSTDASEIRLLSGTYTENINIERGGITDYPLRIIAVPGEQVIFDGSNHTSNPINVKADHVQLVGIEIKNSAANCVRIHDNSQFVRLTNLTVHDCALHGISIQGQHVVVEGSEVYLASANNSKMDGLHGWQSGLKASVSADDLDLKHNYIHHNYGEGIAVTRASNVRIFQTRVIDNFSGNIYIDNSWDIRIEGNFLACTDDSVFAPGGVKSTAIGIGEEAYYDEDWNGDAKLANLEIVNNIAINCKRAITGNSPEVTGGGFDNLLIAYNTFWKSDKTVFSFLPDPAKTQNVRIFNNIIYRDAGNLFWTDDESEFTLDNNLWSRTEDCPAVMGGNGICGHAILTDPTSMNLSGFLLKEASPARGNAKPLENVSNDLLQIARPLKQPDIGSLQYTPDLPSVVWP